MLFKFFFFADEVKYNIFIVMFAKIKLDLCLFDQWILKSKAVFSSIVYSQKYGAW